MSKTRGRYHLISASGRRKIEMITGSNPKRRQRRRADIQRYRVNRQPKPNYAALMP